MIKLLKYELKKRAISLITFLIILLAAEGLAIYLIGKGRQYTALGALVIGFMFFSAILMAFIDVATQYYNDFKKSQGTLLFLTPNNGYKIVGSKMIFGAAELFIGLGLVTLLAWLANAYAVSKGSVGIGPELAKIKEMMAFGYGKENVWLATAGFLFLVFIQYFATQSIAISSVTIGRTILSKNQYNWLWAVLSFIGAIMLVQTLNGIVLIAIGMNQGILGSSFVATGARPDMTSEIGRSIGKIVLIGGLEYIFWIVVSFFLSSTLLNKKIDI